MMSKSEYMICSEHIMMIRRLVRLESFEFIIVAGCGHLGCLISLSICLLDISC
jgi:hypothetical protein